MMKVLPGIDPKDIIPKPKTPKDQNTDKVVKTDK